MKQKFHKIIGAASLLLLGLASMANAAHEAFQQDGEGNYYVNMPEGFTSLNYPDDFPEGVTSFKLYDDGGKDGYYSEVYSDLYISVPKGYKARIEGKINLGGESVLDICDYGEAFAWVYRGFGYSGVSDFGPIYSSNAKAGQEAVTLEIQFDGKLPSSEGFEISVTIFKEVEDVTLKDGEINMPVMGTNKLTITQEDIDGGLTSFTVYDDGGYSNPYSKNANGFLQIDVPEGYVFKVNVACALLEISESGEVSDGLVVYDGNTTDNVLWQAGVAHTVDGEGAVFVSSKNSMTLNSFSDGNVQNGGFHITVEIIRPTILSVAKVLYNPWSHNKSYAIIDGSYTGTDALDIGEDIEVDTVVFNRTFSTNGNGYSTITLPFSIAGSKLEGVDAILQFVGMGKDAKGNDEAHVSYVWCSEAQAAADAKCASALGELEAYTPYLVKVAAEKIGFKSGDSKITLQSTKGVVPETRVNTADGDYVLRGTLAKKSWSKGDPELGYVWGYAATDEYVNVGDFVKAGPGAWINPLRAYVAFEPAKPKSVAAFKNASASKAAPQAVIASGSNTPDVIPIVIVDPNENGGEHTTAIGMFDTRTGKIRLNNESSRTFDLKGRSVGKPTAKGIYLKNNQTFKF